MEGFADQCRAWCPPSAVLVQKAPGGPPRVSTLLISAILCGCIHMSIYTRACVQDINLDLDSGTQRIRNKHCMIVRIVRGFYAQRIFQAFSVCASIGCIALIWTAFRVWPCL